MKKVMAAEIEEDIKIYENVSKIERRLTKADI
jgi:hypothetical protein